MNIAQAARAYAAALDRLEAAQTYMKNTYIEGHVSARVSWPEGSACVGYKELVDIISAQVATQMPIHLNAAIAELERQAHAAERVLINAQAEAHDKVGAT